MPRLTNQSFIDHYVQLRRAWLLDQTFYTALTPNQQRELHAYFRPAEELTAEQLIEHRRTMSKTQPSLPNRAGKTLVIANRAYKQTKERLSQPQNSGHGSKRGRRSATI